MKQQRRSTATTTTTKTSKRGGRRRASSAAAMQGTSRSGDLKLHLDRFSLLPLQPFPSGDPRATTADEAEDDNNKDCCILSQDFFCTPDYITPEAPPISYEFGLDKENTCPRSPEKSVTDRKKRCRLEDSGFDNGSIDLPCDEQTIALRLDAFGTDEIEEERSPKAGLQKKRYVSQSAVALRCRAIPPPCIQNPYFNTTSEVDLDIFGDRRLKSAGFSPLVGGDGLSRYRTDFHEIEQIGCGNFSHVFKVLKRIDGCMYAVKRSIKRLHHDVERRRALMEVQALAALGSHENVVGYYTSWFENEQLYIQMELCDRSLSINKGQLPKGAEVVGVLYQMAKALQFMHEHGIAHLDVKPENIYVKNNVYKLGDFGCATLIDRSLPIEEGDSRYMPQEMLNDQYEHLDKVDIFSLGAATYELVKGSPLPDSGPQFSYIREGRIPLLPGYSVQLQNLLKAMMDPNPVKRPSAKEILENPIFEKARKSSTKQSHSALPGR